MSVPQQTPITSYTANGVSTVFSFGFFVAAAADLVVQVAGVTKTLNVDYTVTGTGISSGGSVTFTSPPANGAAVTIYRDTPVERQDDFQTGGDLPADELDRQFDRLWQVLQELISGGKIPENVLRVPNGDALDELPGAAGRALRLVGFDSLGRATTVAPADQSASALALQLASSSLNTQGAGMVGWSAGVTYPAGSVGAAIAASGAFMILTSFGATGTADDTAVVQAALNAASAAKRALLIPTGTYTVSPINIPSNTVLFFEPGAVLLAKTGYGVNDRMFNINGVSNVTIYGNGAQVKMLKSEYVSGEQRHAVFIINSTDVRIYDLTALDSGGDGFYIGSTYGVANTYPKRVNLIGCRAINNRRQGLSIVAGDTINIEGCTFEGTTGTPPAYGIDIEPDNSLDVLRNINITNCSTKNNYGGGIIIALQFLAATATNDVSINICGWVSDNDGANSPGNANSALRITGNGTGAWGFPIAGLIKVSNFEIRNPKSSGIWSTYWQANKTPYVIVEDGVILNPGSASPTNDEDKCGVVIWGYNLGAQDFGNIEINRVRVRDTRGTAATYSPVYVYKTTGASGVGQARGIRLRDVMGEGFTPLSGRGHLLAIVDMDQSSVTYSLEQIVDNIANSADVTRSYAGYTITCTVARIITLPKAATNRGLSYRFANAASGQTYQLRPTTGDYLDYTATNTNVDLVLARLGAFVDLQAVDGNAYRATAIHDWAKRPGPQQAAETTTPASQQIWVTAMPTSGFFARGDIAWNINFSIGVTPYWARLTTGTGHVLNTDWRAAPVL